MSNFNSHKRFWPKRKSTDPPKQIKEVYHYQITSKYGYDGFQLYFEQGTNNK